MFEQSILATAPVGRKTGAVFASFTAQILGIGVFICVPLIYSDVLPPFKLSLPLIQPIAPPLPEPVVQTSQSAATSEPVRAVSPARIFRPLISNSAATSSQTPVFLDAGGAPLLTAGDGAPQAPGVPSMGVLPGIERPGPAATVATTTKPPDHVVVVGGDVQAAKIVKRVIPAYPPLARQTRVFGTVHLVGVIAKDGTVQRVQVMSGNPLLVKAAVDAVSQWLYKPTVLDGQPVEVIAPIDVVFTLQ